MAELKERYADALFQLSLESGTPEIYREQAVFVKEVLQSEQYEQFLLHPHIPDTEKRQLLQNLFADKIASDFMGFLCLAIAKNREVLILPALSAYIELANRYSGKVVANVVSAAQLTEEQIAALHVLLSKKLDKQVEILPEVDPALIGGFYIHVDGRLIDRTVRTQLKNMKESIERGSAQ